MMYSDLNVYLCIYTYVHMQSHVWQKLQLVLNSKIIYIYKQFISYKVYLMFIIGDNMQFIKSHHLERW